MPVHNHIKQSPPLAAKPQHPRRHPELVSGPPASHTIHQPPNSSPLIHNSELNKFSNFQIPEFSNGPTFSNFQIAQFSNYLSIPSPEDTLIAREQQYEFYEFIDCLPWFLREVTYLHFYRNLSIKQIAKLLNKPVPLIQGWLAHSIYWLKIFVLKFKPPE